MRERLQRRLLVHHLPLLCTSAISVAALYFTRPYSDPLNRASFATAYPALFLVGATLLFGPLNVLLKRRNPVSNDLRRDLGIWAGIFSVLHTAVGQNVHLRGRPWLYYVYEHTSRHTIPLRHDLFGFSNYTGAVSVLLLIALLATSNDASLRALGTPRWKQLQRWNYLAFALAAAHALGYQATEKHNRPFVITVVTCIAITCALQTAGFVRRRAVLTSGLDLRRTQLQRVSDHGES
jgi:sulfoxide reductase heme-binding subunit YedZ